MLIYASLKISSWIFLPLNYSLVDSRPKKLDITTLEVYLDIRENISASNYFFYLFYGLFAQYCSSYF